MTKTRWILAAATGAIIMSLPQTTRGHVDEDRPPAQATYQSRVDLVAITATVQAKDGSYVTNLVADDFHVLDNGVPQTISFFGADNVPVDVALLIDNSGSMGAVLPAVQHAAGILVDALGANDQVAAVTFGGAIRQRIAPTTDHAQVKNALAHLSTGGATPLYDAVYFALRTLNSHHDHMRRRAIVVLTDGDDTASLMSYEAVLELSREAGIAIYIVSLRTAPSAKTAATMQVDYEMHTLTADTGGRIVEASEAENLDAAYRSIARELGHQYSIGYIPSTSSTPARHSRFQPVSVVVPGRSVVVRARRGYIARER